MNLNNKGFTLIEVLAVVVILSIIMAIMVPSVNSIMNKNKEDNYKDLENSIISATKMYISDNRYEIVIGECDSDNKASITSIGGVSLTGSKIFVKKLVDVGNIKTNSSGEIINPKDSTKLNQRESYVLVKYLCDKKDYEYVLDSLKWVK